MTTHHIVFLTGPRGSGKTSSVRAVVENLQAAGHRVGGILQPAWPVSGQRQGYDVLDVATGESRPLARRRDTVGRQGLGFRFDAAAFAWAQERLLAGAAGADVLVVDELGRLEATGDGHVPALRQVLETDRRIVIVAAVRADVHDEVAQQVGEPTLDLPCPLSPSDRDDLVTQVRQWTANDTANS